MNVKNILTILLLVTSMTNAQNLVFNPSFEDTVSCSQWSAIGIPNLPCNYWYQSIGSPDFWSTSYTQWCGQATMPFNATGFQLPKTGTSCAGFAASAFPFFTNAKECITGKLNTPLIMGHKYFASFFLNSCDNCRIHIDKIGAYFSADSINPDSSYLFNIIPQVENAKGNIITDTINWTEVSGYFFAQGGEQWITIGCFQPDSSLMFDSIPNWIIPEAYYYLDDVSVIDCTATNIVELNVVEFQLQNNPASSTLNFTSKEKIISCAVFDLLGNKVLIKNFETTISNHAVDVSILKQGMYLLMVEDKNKKVGYKKFIKM